MDEQLLQQLAQQIDAQTAQAVQSHNVQEKGAYLWQKYPQVHSCKTYNDAVILLAREQAMLQQSQMFTQPVNTGGNFSAIQGNAGVPQTFGTPPPTNIFGTSAIPQTGNAAGTNFTAFKVSEKSNKKVTTSSIIVLIILAGVVLAVIIGIALSIGKAVSGNGQAETVYTDDLQYEDPFEELFGD